MSEDTTAAAELRLFCGAPCWLFGIWAGLGVAPIMCTEHEGHYPATPHKTTISFSRPAGTFTITWTEEAP